VVPASTSRAPSSGRVPRADDVAVGLSLIAVRLWVVVGDFGVVRRLWNHWEVTARKNILAAN